MVPINFVIGFFSLQAFWWRCSIEKKIYHVTRLVMTYMIYFIQCYRSDDFRVAEHFSVYVILWWDIIDSHLFAIIRQSIYIDWRISPHRKWHQSLWRGLNEKSPTVRWWTINSSKVTNIIRHEIIVLRS